jgi:hypothetical protein
MRTKYAVRLSVVAPPEASPQEIADFIADSLEWAGGCRRPEDPMFGSLKIRSVTVSGVKYAYKGSDDE